LFLKRDVPAEPWPESQHRSGGDRRGAPRHKRRTCGVEIMT
jgi:hypothetical protein